MINSRKSYPNVYRMLFVVADSEANYGNRFPRPKLEIQPLYDVWPYIHYFFQRLTGIILDSNEKGWLKVMITGSGTNQRSHVLCMALQS